MKRLLIAFFLLASTTPTIVAGKWDSAARGVYMVTKEPEKALSFVGFLIDLFLMCIPIAIVAGIVSIILKSVFSLDKDDTIKSFFVVGGILLVICLIIYFIV